MNEAATQFDEVIAMVLAPPQSMPEITGVVNQMCDAIAERGPGPNLAGAKSQELARVAAAMRWNLLDYRTALGRLENLLWAHGDCGKKRGIMVNLAEHVQWMKGAAAGVVTSTAGINATAEALENAELTDEQQADLCSHGVAVVRAITELEEAHRQHIMALERFAAAIGARRRGVAGTIEWLLAPGRLAATASARADDVSAVLVRSDGEMSDDIRADLARDGNDVVDQIEIVRSHLRKYLASLGKLSEAIFELTPGGGAG